MTHRVFNFGAGPSTIPLPVMQRIQEELLNYQGLGVSIIELSHRDKIFMDLLDETIALARELMNIPSNYRVLFTHGGAQMQFAGIPLNLINYKPARKSLYVNSGLFATRSIEEGMKFGKVSVCASSEDTAFDRIPEVLPDSLDQEASYLYIVTNNTVMGTQWKHFPETNGIPLVGDATSEILSRPIDISKFGLLYAGFQKNLGPAGMCMVIVREDLLGYATPETPSLLDYSDLNKKNSLGNTINTFAIYVANLVLHWVKDSGGVPAFEKRNEEKAALVYDALDASGLFKVHAVKEHRSPMNATFDLHNEALTEIFLEEALAEGLFALKGHFQRGGMRASLYNAMTLEGAKALSDFLVEFERRHG